jgi:hypothetical protein
LKSITARPARQPMVIGATVGLRRPQPPAAEHSGMWRHSAQRLSDDLRVKMDRTGVPKTPVMAIPALMNIR